MFTTRRFGVEVEAYGLSQEDAVTAIRHAGYRARVCGYSSRMDNGWSIITDGSILGSRGFEAVSPVLSGTEGLEQVREVLNALAAAGAKVNKSCGLHVHHEMTDATTDNLVTLVNLYRTFESEIDTLVPPSRRANNNTYCGSVNQYWTNGRVESAVESARQSWSNNRAAFFASQQRDRYCKLNLMAFVEHGTVEFRQHSGTVDGDKAVAWIVFTQGLVESAKKNTKLAKTTRNSWSYLACAAKIYSSQNRCQYQQFAYDYLSARRNELAS